MPAMNALFVSASLLHAASGLAQHSAPRSHHSANLDLRQNVQDGPYVVDQPDLVDPPVNVDQSVSVDSPVSVDQPDFVDQRMIDQSDAVKAIARSASLARSTSGFEGHSMWKTCSKVNSDDGWEPANRNRCLDANLIFMRVFKTGTSSMSGVLLRIAARNGLNGVSEKYASRMPEPMVSTNHFKRANWQFQEFVLNTKEFTKPNILVAMVRDPVERWLSHYYYRFSKGESDADILGFLRDWTSPRREFEMKFLRSSGGHCGAEHCDPDEDQGPAEVIHSYPLVGLQERFNESVVVLMFLLGLDNYCDVLFVDSKVSSSGVQSNGEKWHPHIPLKEQPEKVKKYVASAEFQKSIEQDKQLHRFASLRLDNQIRAIGQARFEKRLKIYGKWLEMAKSSCEGKKSNFNGCYIEDLGCKYECLDQFCHAHGDALKVEDPDLQPMWQDDHFKVPFPQSM